MVPDSFFQPTTASSGFTPAMLVAAVNDGENAATSQWSYEVSKLNYARAKPRSQANSFYDERRTYQAPQLAKMSVELKEVFDRAEERQKGTAGWEPVLSMRRYYFMNGFLTPAQQKYLFDLAGQVKKALPVKCKACGSVRNARAERPHYLAGFCSKRCEEAARASLKQLS